jgi:hypothetical protein
VALYCAQSLSSETVLRCGEICRSSKMRESAVVNARIIADHVEAEL